MANKEDCCNYAYKMKNSFDLEGIRQLMKFFHVYKCLENMKNPRVLDIGAGFSEVYDFLVQNGFKLEYNAIDIEKKSDSEGINFIKMDLTAKEKLPFFGGSFDAILLLDTLQNIREDCGRFVINEARRVMKTSGSLCISTRNSLIAPETDASNHVFRWDIDKLAAELESRSFEVKDLFGINYGMNEEESDRDMLNGPNKRFFPKRVYRSFCGLEDWKKCKYVMLDCKKC
jgi:SAM-dependent methyltransferase